MYELIAVEENDATRFIKLNNLETNLIDDCFDDSELVSKDNFSFMKVGNKYNCKIKLFGRPVTEKNDKTISCKVINQDVIVGIKSMVKVQNSNNVYYIPKQKIPDYKNGDEFEFFCTRKDLIQVENIVHADLL